MSYYHNATIEVGDEFVTLYKAGHSQGLVARILGREGDTLVLDRLIHDRFTRPEGWTVSGFVATELTRSDKD